MSVQRNAGERTSLYKNHESLVRYSDDFDDTNFKKEEAVRKIQKRYHEFKCHLSKEHENQKDTPNYHTHLVYHPARDDQIIFGFHKENKTKDYVLKKDTQPVFKKEGKLIQAIDEGGNVAAISLEINSRKSKKIDKRVIDYQDLARLRLPSLVIPSWLKEAKTLVAPYEGKTIDKVRLSGEIIPVLAFMQLINDVFDMNRKFIFHGDIKPENLVYNAKENKVKLIDFDSRIQMFEDSQEIQRQLKESVFTPAYCPVDSYPMEIYENIVGNKLDSARKLLRVRDMYGLLWSMLLTTSSENIMELLYSTIGDLNRELSQDEQKYVRNVVHSWLTDNLEIIGLPTHDETLINRYVDFLVDT